MLKVRHTLVLAWFLLITRQTSSFPAAYNACSELLDLNGKEPRPPGSRHNTRGHTFRRLHPASTCSARRTLHIPRLVRMTTHGTRLSSHGAYTPLARQTANGMDISARLLLRGPVVARPCAVRIPI